ncbi:hypothetical protein PtrM4_053420 [Pyrenophora tritici-repentis]|uniref:Uncharacterized protein n=1 Tax=Pyrenophora tritici-repentis TaxID=45151 RepID=A0A834RKD7_9PLEO|nr:hypothetical protein PtrM4_053420 [Pyrenophora tritici-repentis]
MFNVGLGFRMWDGEIRSGNEREEHDETKEGQGEEYVHAEGTKKKDKASKYPVRLSVAGREPGTV